MSKLIRFVFQKLNLFKKLQSELYLFCLVETCLTRVAGPTFSSYAHPHVVHPHDRHERILYGNEFQ